MSIKSTCLLSCFLICISALPSGELKAQNEIVVAIENAKPIRGYTWSSRANKILEALREEAEFDFFETRAGDAIDKLQSTHRIPIVLDESAEDNSFDRESLITIKIDNVSLASGMNVILNEFKCTWFVDNEVLYIASQKHASQKFLTRTYDCRNLVAMIEGPDEDNFKKLIDIVENFGDPESWRDKGGNGSVAEIGGRLVIIQTPHVQRVIEHALDGLSKDFARDGESANDKLQSNKSNEE